MTKEYIYTVEELAKTFTEHAKELRDKEMERCKGTSLYIENFCFAKAMQAICEEICRLRKGVIQHPWNEEK
jgi:hypothetical protein